MPRAKRYPPDNNPPPPGDGTLVLIQTNPYVLLVSIDLPTDPETKLRMAAYPETVYYGRANDGTPVPFYPFSFGVGQASVDTEASIPTVSLEAQNITLEMAALMETYNYLIGQRAVVTVIRIQNTPDGVPDQEDEYDVLDGELDQGVARLTLGRAALQKKDFPDSRITRNYCSSPYGGILCGYDTTRSGALPTCSKLKDGPNGCTEHGDDEVAASLPREHPKRWRSFPGVRRQSGTGVS